MPHPLIHVGMSIGTGYILTGGAKKGKEDWYIISLCTVLQGFIDLDHIFSASSGIRYFHNLTVTFNIPISIFIMASIIPFSRKAHLLRKTGLILAVVGFGHLAADIWAGGTYHLLYPLSHAAFEIPQSSTTTGLFGIGLKTTEMAIIIWGAIMILGRLFYEIIELERLEMECLEVENDVLPFVDMGFKRSYADVILEDILTQKSKKNVWTGSSHISSNP